MLIGSNQNSNIMMQDINISVGGVNVSIRQSDLVDLCQAERVSGQVLVYRVLRSQLGGGFGDPYKHPYAWAVIVQVDGRPARVINARGAGREWNSLDRLERWLREQGFRYWCVRNDLEPVD
jgi:hypothetical protein